MTATQDDTIAELQRANAGLRQELGQRDTALAQRKTDFDERIEHQVATIDVLKAMSASPGDTQPVFDLIARSAAGLCEARVGLWELREGQIHFAAHYGIHSALVEPLRRLFPRPADPSTVAGRAILERRVIHVRDVASDPMLSKVVRDLGGSAILGIPLLRDAEPIGAIVLNGNPPGGFSDSQIELLMTFAEQAVIAIRSAETFRALQESTDALAQRNSEYGERIEQQSATIDVLKVMSSTPDDIQPVFDLIVRRAAELCNGSGAGLLEFDGELVHYRSSYGLDPDATRAYAAIYPMPPTRSSIACRAILDKRIIHIRDMDAEPGIIQAARNLGIKSNIALPLMRDDTVIGVFVLDADETGGFSDSQIALLQTFAEQAVIAITSVETYRALQTRTSDLQETLEYQTATSDLLKVISRSTFDLQPVLATVAETAAKLCLADHAMIIRREGDRLRLMVNFGFPPEYEAHFRKVVTFPFSPGAPEAVHRAIAERRAVHIHDVAAVPGYADVSIRLGKQRTSLGVPLLREGEPIGVIILARQRVEPFTDRQIDLVSTFADQAVIAIENTRLISEQREALEQQTATAEVLQVINASPGHLAPVFDTMLDNAMHLCGAAFGELVTFDGEHFKHVAVRGVPAAYAEYRRTNPRPPGVPGSIPVRLREGEDCIHVSDLMADEIYRSGNPSRRAMVDLGGARTLCSVALRKNDTLLGYFTIYRQEIRPFSDKQIALLKNFAAQAVIAMENARLINEQREALEQQTATAEVLQVINASPGNLEPVFKAILEKAHRLCGARVGALGAFDGTNFRALATYGYPEQAEAVIRQPYPREPHHEPLFRGEHLHVCDVKTHPWTPELKSMRIYLEQAGLNTILSVPMRKDGVLLGFISAASYEVRPFSGKEIALLENFAAQGVIAMENARLITETQEALEQQTATAEVLQVINASPGDLAPVFDVILKKAMRLCEAAFGELDTFDGERFKPAALLGIPAAYAKVRTSTPRTGMSGTVDSRFREGANLLHITDLMAEDIYTSGNIDRRSLVDLGGARTALAVALRKDDVLLGNIMIYRQEVRPFSERQVALLQSFAAQAVIAMENARLISEQQEALEQQTATAEVLQVINASPGNLTPVFEAILEKAHDLCDIAHGDLQLYDGEYLHSVAQRGLSAEFADRLRQGYRASDSPASRPLLAGDRFVHITDAAAVDFMVFRSSVRPDGIRTVLFVPLRKDGALLGMIASARREVRPFTEKEIALLENFAAQAVIAMENARLITEQREALEQQTATAEVLQVINASPGDLVPVFEAILEKAHRFCGAALGSIVTFDGEYFRAEVTHGYPEEYATLMRQGFRGRPQSAQQALVDGERFVHIADWRTAGPWQDDEVANAFIDATGVRTFLVVPLSKDGNLLGFIGAHRQEVRAFTDKEISLLESFAAQAVIAMENARLLADIRQRQEELRITFANMGDGVAMFDETPRLVAWNSKFQELLEVPDEILNERQTYTDYIRYLTERGEYGPDTDTEIQVHRFQERMREHYSFERTRPDGRVIEIRHNPVPEGGFVLIYTDITDRKRSEAEIRAARDAAEEASRTIEAAYRDLKAAQANLIQAEKMASLGQLTAGIAHEIKNPLNFVNNFAELSVDLLGELKDAIAPAEPTLTEKQRAEVEEVSVMLTSNLEKITEHGKRADSIVKAMLEHSRGSSGERRMVDLNALIDEALNLAYHGARAQDQSFNITLERDFGEGISPIEVNPQDITRVLLNLFANGFYATTKRARDGGGAGFVPTLKVTTRDAGEAVEIRVRDNGTGIPADIRDKLFQPFFTTKPTGEGTGLGLSITYDIVTQQHGGSIAVDSKVGEYSEFTVLLPRNP